MTQPYEKIFVINLERRPDRWNRVVDTSNAFSLHPLERIDAIDAKHLTINQLCGHSTSMCCNFCVPSMIAVGMSHRKVWNKMLDDGTNTALVFEDDFLLPDDFHQRLYDVVGSLPKNWKMVYLSCYGDCHTSNPGNKLISKLFVQKLSGPKKVNEQISMASCPLVLVAYMVSKQGARELLEVTKKISYHVDIQIARSKKFMSSGVYQVNSPFVTQTPSDSDNTIVQGKYVALDFLLKTALSRSGYENYGAYTTSPLARCGDFKIDPVFVMSIVIAVLVSVMSRGNFKTNAFFVSSFALFSSFDFVLGERSVRDVIVHLILILLVSMTTSKIVKNK
jgi:GR25 family glycosyltransferase involved in LPS biosynthesis